MIQDPVSVVEQIAQSVKDTFEQEGIAYVTSEELTAFIPATGVVKLVKDASKLKGPGKTKGSNSSYSKEFIPRKIDAAKSGLADVKVPSFTRERLSTGISDIPTVKVEMKPLSETHPQTFAVKADGIKGLTSSQIEDKFVLPTTPKFVADVELDAGTRIRTGTVNPLFGFEGGGQQFDLMGQRVGNFTNPRPLP